MITHLNDFKTSKRECLGLADDAKSKNKNSANFKYVYRVLGRSDITKALQDEEVC